MRTSRMQEEEEYGDSAVCYVSNIGPQGLFRLGLESVITHSNRHSSAPATHTPLSLYLYIYLYIYVVHVCDTVYIRQ